ncbi:MAG: hypothetical protein P8Z75_03635 [Gammaproteobacteria bacterium]|jgi:uncharacterized membrane protein YagU involved in acid resistance
MIYVWQPAALLHVGVWGFVATAMLSIVLQGSQGIGLSRLSLPFLVGTVFTGNRDRASVYGFTFYIIGGWIFAFMYYLVFSSVGHHDWWFGALIGALHGLFLLIVAMPLLPHLHPRIATEYDGPDANRRLEPPGFLGLNYGRMTPVTTVIGHMLYGAILGAALPPAIWY